MAPSTTKVVNRCSSTAAQVSTASSTVNRLTRETDSNRTAPSTTKSAIPTVFTKSVEAQAVAAGIAGAGLGAGRESAIAASAKLVSR